MRPVPPETGASLVTHLQPLWSTLLCPAAAVGRLPEFYGRYLFLYLTVIKRSADCKSCVSESLDMDTTLPEA